MLNAYTSSTATARRWKTLHPCCAAAALAAIASGAGAQVRDTARSDTTNRLIRLDPIVVTAARVPVRQTRTGFSLSMLGSAALRLQHAPNAVEMLRNLDGTFIDEANGPGGPTIVRLRGGEEVFTQIVMDGVELNENGGFFDFQGFAPVNLDRVEVARGPQSALFGSSAMSGVVQFITRSGEVGRPRISVAGEGTGATRDGGGYRGEADISGGSQALRYAGGFGWTFNRGIYQLPNDTKTRDASLRLNASPSDRLWLSGTLRFLGMDSNLPVRDPGATRVPLDPNARDERDRLISSVSARLVTSPHIDQQLRGTLYRQDFTYDDKGDNLSASASYPFFIFNATFHQDSRVVRKGLEYDFEYRSRGARDAVVLSWGVRGERESLDNSTLFEGSPDSQQLARNSTSVFGEALLTPSSRLDLLAGARVEKFDGLDAAVTPRGSAVLHLVPGQLSLRLAAGRAYKAPNIQDQYANNPFIVSNPDLKPETSTSIEGGVDWQSRDGRVSSGVTVFRQNFRDLIRAVQFDSTRQQNRNLGESRATGVEARFELRPAARWSAGMSGGWLRTRVLNATGLPAESFPEGEELPFRPRAIGAAFLAVTPAPGLDLRLRAQYVGAQTVLTERFSGSRVRLNAYVLPGLTANYSVRGGWSLWARLDNVADTRYQTGFDRHGIPRRAPSAYAGRTDHHHGAAMTSESRIFVLRHCRRLLPSLALLAATVGARPASAQSVLDRPPNMGGTWTGDPGMLYFTFIHRFVATPAPERKVINVPTFLLAGAAPGHTLWGFRYATNSGVKPAVPNEWEFFGRWNPLAESRGAPVDLAVHGGYNTAAQSVDGELALSRRLGRLRLLGAGRAFSSAYDSSKARFAVAGGATLMLTSNIALAGDVAGTLDRKTYGQDIAWGAGLQLHIPYTPHTFSLQVTNTNSATLEGASVGSGRRRYGFEFTIPLTMRRYFGSRSTAAPAVQANGDTVRIIMQGLQYQTPRVEIRPGTTVVWENHDAVPHTSTSDKGLWDSGLIDAGRSWAHTFGDPGTYAFHCTPHPFMKGEVIVR